MDISYKKDGNQNFMIIKDENINENDYKLQMVINNDIKGIIPLSVKSINNKQEIHYGISSMISIESMYAKKQMSGKDIYNLVKSIKNMSDSMKEYLLDINGILFGIEFVYLKRQDEKYSFCYYPENNANYQESLREFFDKLLEYINHNDRQAVLIAYGIQQITISDSFTVQDLMECAEKHMKNATVQKYAYEENKERCQVYNVSEKKEQTNIETYPKTSRKNFFRNIVEIFSGKGKYKCEDDLLCEEEVNYGDKVAKNAIATDTENIYEEREDATMLLTSSGIIENITLRRIDSEEQMEITPNKYPCVLGKSKKSSDFYIDSPVVSRVHMRISEDMAGYFVEDLNSTNGTYVNGVQLHPHELKEINSGDQITMANVDFIVE